jgi:hypothetical protein
MAGSSKDFILENNVTLASDSDEDVIIGKLVTESEVLASHNSGVKTSEKKIRGLTGKLLVLEDRKKKDESAQKKSKMNNPPSPSPSTSKTSSNSPTLPEADYSPPPERTVPVPSMASRSPTPERRAELVPNKETFNLVAGPNTAYDTADIAGVVSPTSPHVGTPKEGSPGTPDSTRWLPPDETSPSPDRTHRPAVPDNSQLPPTAAHPADIPEGPPSRLTELQQIASTGNLTDEIVMNLLLDPKPDVDSIVILDDSERDNAKKIYTSTRVWQFRGNGNRRFVDGIRNHHLLPNQFVELSTLPRQEDYWKGTAILIQRVGCEMYGIIKNEKDFLGEILCLGDALPYGHKAIAALKVFYGLPRNKKHSWKYACEVFTGQIVIVLASIELRDLFTRELHNKCLADSLEPCLIKTPNVGIHADRQYTMGSTRFGNHIWEFRDQFVQGSHGELLDTREYSKDYREYMGME